MDESGDESISDASSVETESAADSFQGDSVLVFEIDPSESEVRFIIDEVLRDEPTTVVGVSNQVAGGIAIDTEDPAESKVGVTLVNARTLETDNDFRNRAIQNQILDTGEFEFVTFTPTEISGIPNDAMVGDVINFQITGELVIRDFTQEVTFDVTLTPISEERLEGKASTTIMRGDFGLTIPSVPQVADVSEEVILEIKFTAKPAN
ncbi:MAG: YceI family protein [Anaerolineales bacterium]|nr:YceI family protein [Anaerolineales bacterium]